MAETITPKTGSKMTATRRGVLRTGAVSAVAAGVAPLVSGAVWAAGLSGPAPLRGGDRVLLADRRYAPSPAFAAAAGGWFAQTLDTGADAGPALARVGRSLAAGTAGLAGMVDDARYVLFGQIAREHGLGLVYRGRHRLRPGAASEHRLEGAPPVLDGLAAALSAVPTPTENAREENFWAECLGAWVGRHLFGPDHLAASGTRLVLEAGPAAGGSRPLDLVSFAFAHPFVRPV